MQSPFLQSYRLSITPLSPIHIGCGEDYVPTNYVIDPARGFLYGFNPEEVYLTESELRELRSTVADFRKLRKFYSQHVDAFRPWARRIVPVGRKGLQMYQKMLAPKGGQKATEFTIERTAHESGIRMESYIPGSSLKGTVVTALQERLNRGGALKRPSDVQDLLGGNCENSPMRFLRIGDCQGTDVLTRVFISYRFFKSDMKPDGFPMALEGIVPGQFRKFGGEVTVAAGQNRYLPHVYEKVEDVLEDLHRYSLARWREEISIYRALSPMWANGVEKLLADMKVQFHGGRAALIRLGKNAGAQSKTLHGENLPRIQIRHKNKRMRPPEELPETQTLCLTNEDEEVWMGLPWGWAIIEADPEGDTGALKSWCDQTQTALHQHSLGCAVAEERGSLLKEKMRRIEILEDQRRQEELQRIQNEEKEKEVERKAQALAEMSEESRQTTIVCEALEAYVGNVNPGTTLFNEVKALLEQALGWSSAEEKKSLALRIQPLMKKKNMYQGKAEKLFKVQLRALRGDS